jgi:CHAT domain-containing protein
LQSALGPGRALVEYTRFAGLISAFVVTETDIVHFPDIALESEIRELIERLHFQFGALRYGAENLGPMTGQLKSRADAYLEKLHRLLVEPLAGTIGGRDLAVVPAGGLNYVPFGALRSGRYLVEERAVAIAPSAAVWLALQSKPSRSLKSAFVIGYADEKIPHAEREIEAVAARFRGCVALSGTTATFGAFRDGTHGKDVVHIACHGQFRPDNPLFSCLRLSDGFVTVRDICSQRIEAAVVTLSACETGLSGVAGGEEILGLARGFFGAGAESLVLSLWTVSDTATARLMADFYENLTEVGVPEALRRAQLRFIERGEHPYFWAPFTAAGR